MKNTIPFILLDDRPEQYQELREIIKNIVAEKEIGGKAQFVFTQTESKKIINSYIAEREAVMPQKREIGKRTIANLLEKITPNDAIAVIDVNWDPGETGDVKGNRYGIDFYKNYLRDTKVLLCDTIYISIFETKNGLLRSCDGSHVVFKKGKYSGTDDDGVFLNQGFADELRDKIVMTSRIQKMTNELPPIAESESSPQHISEIPL